ncbi:hypothetical protein AAHA92_12352 [Salvia divinorum]|uniref:Uncharacterized protein n=1 Tax=Salvia divinorum TaxID=28513 RepID=A0ABD1HKD9_SALDI
MWERELVYSLFFHELIELLNVFGALHRHSGPPMESVDLFRVAATGIGSVGYYKKLFMRHGSTIIYSELRRREMSQ